MLAHNLSIQTTDQTVCKSFCPVQSWAFYQQHTTLTSQQETIHNRTFDIKLSLKNMNKNKEEIPKENHILTVYITHKNAVNQHV